MPAGGLVTAGVLGAISLIKSASDKKKAKALEKSNQRPIESVPQGIKDATALAEQQATYGLPAAVKLEAQKEIQRAGAVALGSATERRAGMETIGAIQQQQQDATGNLTAQDAQLMVTKEGQLINQKNNLGDWQNRVWDWNSKAKYEENAAAIQALKGASTENFNTGLNMIASAGAKGASEGFFTPKNDPTVENPDLYGNTIPDSYATYLQNTQRLRRFSGFQPIQ